MRYWRLFSSTFGRDLGFGLASGMVIRSSRPFKEAMALVVTWWMQLSAMMLLKFLSHVSRDGSLKNCLASSISCPLVSRFVRMF